jgi:hypothetical protein
VDAGLCLCLHGSLDWTAQDTCSARTTVFLCHCTVVSLMVLGRKRRLMLFITKEKYCTIVADKFEPAKQAVTNLQDAMGSGWPFVQSSTRRPRLVQAGFGTLHSAVSNQRTVVFHLYLVKII